MPRPGNKAFANFVEGGMDAVVPIKTFVLTYYRDPMPHIPPTILGYRQASTHYAWVYRPVAQGAVVLSTGSYESASMPMDHYLANKVFFFRVTDHMMYFASAGILSEARGVDDALTACGQYADEILKETHTSDLFYF